jgi:hypothetical protein
MGESNSSTSTAGVSGVGVVQIVFVILKLCKTDPIGGWPWWKVMLPLECSVALMCCVSCCAISLLCIAKDDTVSTPGVDLSAQQREMLYNFSQARNFIDSKDGTGNNPSPDSKASTVEASHTAEKEINTSPV